MTAPIRRDGRLSDDGYLLLAVADDFMAAHQADPHVDVWDVYEWLCAQAGRHPRPATDKRPDEQTEAAKPPPKPKWCGHCNQSSRLMEPDEGPSYRCKACHPLAKESA